MSRYFSQDHEWVDCPAAIELGCEVTIGITDYAQQQLGDVVFVELPALGKILTAGAVAAVVESVKAASDVYSPVSGEVVAINEELKTHPGLINSAAENAAWLFKLKLTALPPENLLHEAAYQSFLATL
jgi:glycine cleavage system H protein